MRRQMQLRPSQGGRFRGPVGTPMPEENPAKMALAQLPWPLGLAWTRRYKVPTSLIRQACLDGYIEPHPTFAQWNLTEKGAALLGVKPPGFREEFAEAGRAMVDAIQRDEATQKIDIGGPPFPMGDAKPVRYEVAPDPGRAVVNEVGCRVQGTPGDVTYHVAVGLNTIRVPHNAHYYISASSFPLADLVAGCVYDALDAVRQAMRDGSPTMPTGIKNCDDGYVVTVLPESYSPEAVALRIRIARI